MSITHQQIVDAGYLVPAAAPDDWRSYDVQDPVPGYFQFDWLSSRHPDLYHKFALSTIGLMRELECLVDLTGWDVLEIAAGTGRATIEAARKARHVTALDIFPAVIAFGKEMVHQAGLANVGYLRGDGFHLPLPSDTFDACLASWAIIDCTEAYRVLKPGGLLVWMGAAPGALCGELTSRLVSLYPDIITEVAPEALYDPAYPTVDIDLPEGEWNGIAVIPPTRLHDFTCLSDYGDVLEAAAILGRLYGPVARDYLLERRQSTMAWRLRIGVARVRKPFTG